MKAKNPDYKRLSPRVPIELRDLIHQIAEKHLPRSSHLAMFEYVLKNGMDELENGEKLDKKWNITWQGVDKRFQHYVPVRHTLRFNKIADSMDPKPRKRELFILILALGLQFYYKEHDEFGIRKD